MHRKLLHLEAADFEQARSLLSSFISEHVLNNLDIVCLGLELSTNPISSQALPPVNQVRNLLGKSSDILIVNAFAGFNPNQFAMVAGTVRGGGYIILLSPFMGDWPARYDPDYSKLMLDAEQKKGQPKRFIHYFTQSLLDWTQTYPHQYIRCGYDSAYENGYDSGNNNDVKKDQDAVEQDLMQLIKSKNQIRHELEPNAEQASLIHGLSEQYQHTQEKQRHEFALIQAQRGRGKSTALGLFVSGLISKKQASVQGVGDSDLSIVVTAQHRSAISSLESVIGPSADSQYQFFPIDSLLDQLDRGSLLACDVLVVDEAAALSAGLLKRLCEHTDKQGMLTVFSTTSDGYEGQGRGFELKFSRWLENRYSDCLRRYTLSTPIRYGLDDPLEQFLDHCLFPGEKTIKPVKNNDVSEIQYAYVTQDQLLESDDLLSDIYGLLLEAHYQTSPDDLRFILDSPDVLILVAYFLEPDVELSSVSMENLSIVSACLAVLEGDFSDELIENFDQKSRRLRGHLVPQKLAYLSGIQWLKKSYLRIVRIVTRQDCRRKHLAQGMLQKLAKDHPDKILCSSFALDGEVLNFWHQSGFNLVHLGNKLEASSGAFSALVMQQPISSETKALFVSQQSLLLQQLMYRKTDLLKTLGGQLLWDCFCNLSVELEMSELETLQIKRFLNQQLALDQLEPAMASFCLSQLSSEAIEAWQGDGLETLRIFFEVFVLQCPASSYYQASGVSGKKAWQQLCRAQLNRILENI